jgi:branched-chain amino acid transport system substrate-binding protein
MKHNDRRGPRGNINVQIRLTVLAAAALLASSAADAADVTVKIGVLTDMSGVAVDDMGPGSVLAAQMAAEDMGGSVAGMKIEIVFADHLQRPDVGATIVRRWFDQENVDAVADVPNSSVALAINQIARATTRCCCRRARSRWN